MNTLNMHPRLADLYLASSNLERPNLYPQQDDGLSKLSQLVATGVSDIKVVWGQRSGKTLCALYWALQQPCFLYLNGGLVPVHNQTLCLSNHPDWEGCDYTTSERNMGLHQVARFIEEHAASPMVVVMDEGLWTASQNDLDDLTAVVRKAGSQLVVVSAQNFNNNWEARATLRGNTWNINPHMPLDDGSSLSQMRRADVERFVRDFGGWPTLDECLQHSCITLEAA